MTRRFPVVNALAFRTQNCGIADLRHCRGVSSSKKCVRANLIVKGGFSAFVADSIGVWGVSGSKCLGFLGVSILLRAGCYCDDTGEIKSIHPLESKNLRVQLGFPCTTIGGNPPRLRKHKSPRSIRFVATDYIPPLFL